MEKDKLELHNVRPEETGAVAEVIRASYKQYERIVPDTFWGEYIKEITDIRSRMKVSDLIVAVFNGKVAGTVTLFLKPPPDSPEGWPAGWAGIRILAVHPDFRSKGIGRALMKECLRRCREKGIKTVALHTTEAMSIARSMYERMGFVRAPEYDFHPPSGTNVMAYRLDL